MSDSSSNGESPPRVFISYSWDSDAHKERVFELAERLRDQGIDAQLDQYEVAPPESWPNWMWNQVEDADFVLVVCTETYHRRFRGKEGPGRGQGATWEGTILTQSLYDAGSLNTRFVPIVLSGEDTEHIPLVLRGATRYQLDRDYEKLYRHLTDQPEFVKRPLGPVKQLPVKQLPVRQLPVRELQPGNAAPPPTTTELQAAYAAKRDAVARGDDTSDIDTRILRLKRESREGSRLDPGDFLAAGRYELLEVVGSGGFAKVWRAYDHQDQLAVAVKVLHGQYVQDRTRRDRFFRGAKRMAALRHPGIVRVLTDRMEEDGHHFFVMEYVAGGDLRRAVLAGRITDETSAVELIVQVSDALAYAHEQGVIHRDVKPANILLEPGGAAKLTDFDLVRAEGTTGGTRTGSMGTFVYAAPEQLVDAKKAGPQADVYGLGMSLVFALHGQDLPPTMMREGEVILSGITCSESVKEVASRAIGWQPHERWKNVREFARALQAARSGESVVAASQPERSGSTEHRASISPAIASAVIGHRLGDRPGATLVCIGGLHGNEPAGVIALERVFRALGEAPADQPTGDLHGEFIGLRGHPEALAAGQRFLEVDLQHHWQPSRVHASRFGKLIDSPVPEDRQLDALRQQLELIFGRARGPVFVIDLHTTGGPSIPFSTIADSLRDLAFALYFPAPILAEPERQLRGTFTDYVGSLRHAAVSIRGGQHDDPASVDLLEAVIWVALEETGILPSPVPRAEQGRRLLGDLVEGLPRIVQARYRHAVSPEDAFVMEPGYTNYSLVQEGQVLAHDKNGPVCSPASGVLLKPLYQTQGTEGFLVGQAFRPFWLKFSALLRRLGLDQMAPWLPGVRAHPELPDSLVVDQRLARWYTVEFFYLLGYGLHAAEENQLVFAARNVG